MAPRGPQAFDVPLSSGEGEEAAPVQRLGAFVQIQVIAKLHEVTGELHIKQFGQRINAPGAPLRGLLIQLIHMRNLRGRINGPLYSIKIQ